VKYLIAAVILAVIFGFGFLLSRSGKPYPALLFNLHKLIAVGALGYWGFVLYRTHQNDALRPAQVLTLAGIALAVLVVIASGGLVSVEKEFPPIFRKLHHLAPYLVVFTTAAGLYLL